MPAFILPVGDWPVSPNGTWQGHRDRRPASVNPGVDYECVMNTTVRAAHDGVVRYSQNTFTGSGGRLVYVRQMTGGTNFIETQYLHLNVAQVKAGQVVKQGDVLGLSGASGYGKTRYYGPHCHVSLYINGVNVDFAAHVAAGLDFAGVEILTPIADPAEVRKLQEALVAHGFKLVVDGSFGTKTHDAVVTLQMEYGLVADGVAGPLTWEALEGNMMNTDQSRKLDEVYNAIFNGGDSMPDAGRPLGLTAKYIMGAVDRLEWEPRDFRMYRNIADGEIRLFSVAGHWWRVPSAAYADLLVAIKISRAPIDTAPNVFEFIATQLVTKPELPAVIARMEGLTEEQVKSIAVTVNDEADQRARERLAAG